MNIFSNQINQIINARKKNQDASDLFFQIRRTGRKAEIEAAFKTVADFDPSWSLAQYEHGVSLMRLGRQAEAIGRFLSCVSTHPDWMAARYHLGVCHERTGGQYLAASIYKSILSLDIADSPHDYAKNFETLGDLYFSLARSNSNPAAKSGIILELQHICEADIKKNGPQCWNQLYLGAVNFHFGNVDAALEYLEKAASLGNQYDLHKPLIFKSSYGASFIRTPQSTREIIQQTSKQPPKIDLRDCQDNHGLVFLISCDSGYYRRFSKMLLSSLLATNENITLHFHILGNTEEISAIKKEALVDHKENNIKINYSYEELTITHSNTYYAISRFLIAHQIIEHYGADVIIGDIDSAVVGDLRKPQEYVGTRDIGVNLSTRQNGFFKFPWNSISGGYVYLKSTPLSISYARDLATLISHFYDPRSIKSWWLDQGALFSITHYYTTTQPDFRIATFVDAEAPKPFLHSINGKTKDDFSAEVMLMIEDGTFLGKASALTRSQPE